MSGSTMPLPTVFGDMQPEEQERDEIEEGGPEHSKRGSQHPGRDDGRDRVCGVVQAVEEIEDERGRDQQDQQRQGEGGVHRRSEMLDDDGVDLIGDGLRSGRAPFRGDRRFLSRR